MKFTIITLQLNKCWFMEMFISKVCIGEVEHLTYFLNSVKKTTNLTQDQISDHSKDLLHSDL